MKTLFLILALALPLANAQAKEVYCSGIESPEWTIQGNFPGAQIELFDNDSWTTFQFSRVIESLPEVYVYEEANGDGKIEMQENGNAQVTAVYISSAGNMENVNFQCQ